MSTPLRKKRGNTIIWSVLALVMVGLGGYGVSNFSGSVSDVATVGDRTISPRDYDRALRTTMASVSQQMGSQITPQQARDMGLDRSVLGQLVASATLENEANRLGISVGDAQLRERIMGSPGLRGADGKFSRDNYSLFLQQQGMTEAEFERQVRDEGARVILQGAVLDGIPPRPELAARMADWAQETRSYTIAHLIASDLPKPVTAPTADEIKAWYDGHNDAYMSPETRKISYVWLSPDKLAETLTIEDAALQAAYNDRKSEYEVPEKRMVSRLVFPSAADADAALARVKAGQATFDDLVKERGLAPADVDLGEMTREELGAAGAPVFALDGPGVIGPVQTDLGPALFAMNGILAAETTSFDEAKDALRDEIAMDRARRMIADKQANIEDILAGGATLEDAAKEAGMELGRVDYNSDADGGIVGYEAFRKAAEAVTADSFPTLAGLDDGGIFALRLDQVVPAALRPLDEVKDKVVADWTKDATHKKLGELAAEKIAELDNGATLSSLGLVTTSDDSFARNGFIADTPPEVGKAIFAMEPGKSQVVDAGGQIYLVTLNAINMNDQASPEMRNTTAQIEKQLGQSTGNDIFELYTRALQSTMPINVNQSAVSAINAQM